jgi:Mn-dependent DtxR family transcriptional regulator
MSEGIVLTSSLEDYLESIYFLESQNQEVRVTDIAVAMDLSKPSVNRAINTLKNAGLVNHEHYGGLSLTDSGRKIAKNVAERHILLKHFLIDLLKIDEQIAEKEACAMEHAVSQHTMEKLSDYLKKIIDVKNLQR